MGCGEFLVKYLLFFTNLIFALAGLALLGIGIAVQVQITVITDLGNGMHHVAPILTIIIGVIVFLIAFFGCCGAIRESNCMLVTYAICMIILMILKLTFAILIFVNLDALKEQITGWLNTAFAASDRKAFYEIQKAFRCCGTTGPGSYGIIPILPDTCCMPNTVLGACTIAESYSTGCTTVLIDYFDTFGKTIGAIAIVVVAIELVAVVFSFCLANHARNKSRRGRY